MKRTIRLATLLLPMLLLVVAGAVNAEEHAFIGSKNCKKCHIKEYKSWEKTTMAQVFEQLKPGERAEAKTAAGLDPDKDYTTDATCLPCHVTGYGQETGFVDIDTTPNLAGVGCEMCRRHRAAPAGEHGSTDGVPTGAVPVPFFSQAQPSLRAW